MTEHQPWVVALTGGVAAGKSAVAERFEALGVPLHDADVAARQVVAPDTPELAAIVELFGTEALRPDGTLDRAAVRERVFDDDQARRQLEAIVHPAVARWLDARIRADHEPYCVLAIPLLAETWPQYAWVDRVLVVDAPDALRVERLMQRDGISEKLARDMLASQTTRERRLELADDVIDNTGAPRQLDSAVDTLHQRYLRMARAKSGNHASRP